MSNITHRKPRRQTAILAEMIHRLRSERCFASDCFARNLKRNNPQIT